MAVSATWMSPAGAFVAPGAIAGCERAVTATWLRYAATAKPTLAIERL